MSENIHEVTEELEDSNKEFQTIILVQGTLQC